MKKDEIGKILGKDDVLVIDVRRKADHDAAPEGLPHAQWRDPAEFSQWKEELPKDKEIVVYCARGGQVSQDIQKELEASGRTAAFLEGGLEAWKKG